MNIIKALLGVFLFLITNCAWGQNLEECGKDNQSMLSSNEVAFLNDYLRNSLNDFDLSGKKIIFITGSSGKVLGSKSDYFDNVREYKEKYNVQISTSLHVLSEHDRIEYGYDAVIYYWVKILSPKSLHKVLKKAKVASVECGVDVHYYHFT